MTKNPLNDDAFDGNDDQIAALKEAIEDLLDQLQNATEALANTLLHCRDHVPQADLDQRSAVVKKSRETLGWYRAEEQDE